MRRNAVTTALCLTATAALALTACGKDADHDKAKPAGQSKPAGHGKPEPFAGQSGSDIADKAMAATSSANSLTIKGNIADDGKPITLDMALDRKKQCVGSVSMGKGHADVIKTDDTVYLKFDKQFLKDQAGADSAAAVSLLAGRWTKSKAGSSNAFDLSEFCDLNKMLDGFKSDDPVARRGKAVTVDGVPAFSLTEPDDDDAKAVDTAYVAAKGKPYLLKVVSNSPKSGGTMTFTDYDKPVDAKAPVDDDILDLDKMTK
jgi:hypothetical protein